MKLDLDMPLGTFLGKLIGADQSEPEWIDVKNERWGLPWKQIAEAGRRGELEITPIGRNHIMVRRRELDRWLDSKSIRRVNSAKRKAEPAPKMTHAEYLIKRAGF